MLTVGLLQLQGVVTACVCICLLSSLPKLRTTLQLHSAVLAIIFMLLPHTNCDLCLWRE